MHLSRIRRLLSAVHASASPESCILGSNVPGFSVQQRPREGVPRCSFVLTQLTSHVVSRVQSFSILSWRAGLAGSDTPRVGAEGACCSVPIFAQGMAVRAKRKAEVQLEPEPHSLDTKVNADIVADVVRLIDGESNEVMPLADALDRARIRGLDLVEVASKAQPPVCKIMDWSAKVSAERKHMSDKLLKMRQAARTATKTKEVRIGCHILAHDLDVKLKKIDELLKKGYRVTVSATYEFRRGMWKQEYPKAIEVAKRVWEMYRTKCQSWFDYNVSGNKQIAIVLNPSTAEFKGSDPFPWESGSKPPPFMIKMQEEAAAAQAAQAGRGGARRR